MLGSHSKTNKLKNDFFFEKISLKNENIQKGAKMLKINYLYSNKTKNLRFQISSCKLLSNWNKKTLASFARKKKKSKISSRFFSTERKLFKIFQMWFEFQLSGLQ